MTNIRRDIVKKLPARVLDQMSDFRVKVTRTLRWIYTYKYYTYIYRETIYGRIYTNIRAPPYYIATYCGLWRHLSLVYGIMAMLGPATVREAIGGLVHAVFVCPPNEVHLALKEGWEKDGNFYRMGVLLWACIYTYIYRGGKYGTYLYKIQGGVLYINPSQHHTYYKYRYSTVRVESP